MGANQEFGSKTDLYVKPVQRTVLMMGKMQEPIPSVPAGNTVGLVGIDSYLIKTGTLSSDENAYPLKSMKLSVSPVVRISVSAKNTGDLTKLTESLKKLSKSDPLAQIQTSESGEHIVAGSGELHVEILFHDLCELSGIEVTRGDPVVSYRETVTTESRQVLGKSPNKHNRFLVTACPFPEGLSDAVENNLVTPTQEPKARARVLEKDFGYNVEEARKIWGFGPLGKGPNFLIDSTKAIQYLNEVKDSCVSGFQGVTLEGTLTEEEMRGIRFDLHDATLHADAIHRGGGQIIPTIKKCCNGSYLAAEPRLQEP